MPTRTAEEKQQIEQIRKTLDEVEDAIKKCLWLPKIHTLKTKRGMTWLRDHINRGRTEPSILLIYEHLHQAHPTWGIYNMIIQLNQERPDTGYLEKEIPPILIDRLCRWESWEGKGDASHPPNFELHASHRDVTDQWGYPFYIPSDDDGVPEPDFDMSRLSQTKKAQRARKNKRYGGICGMRTDADGNPLPRMPLPTPTEAGLRQHQRHIEALKGKKDDELYLKEVRKWYKDTWIPEQLKTLEDHLKNKQDNLKQALKEGRILKEDVTPSDDDYVGADGSGIKRKTVTIEERVNLKRKNLETKLEDGTFMDLEGIYDRWLNKSKVVI